MVEPDLNYSDRGSWVHWHENLHPGCVRATFHPSLTFVCRHCGTSRPTLCKWWRRYLAQGIAGLESYSRRSKRSPSTKTSTCEVALILEVTFSAKSGCKTYSKRVKTTSFNLTGNSAYYREGDRWVTAFFKVVVAWCNKGWTFPKDRQSWVLRYRRSFCWWPEGIASRMVALL